MTTCVVTCGAVVVAGGGVATVVVSVSAPSLRPALIRMIAIVAAARKAAGAPYRFSSRFVRGSTAPFSPARDRPHLAGVPRRLRGGGRAPLHAGDTEGVDDVTRDVHQRARRPARERSGNV